MIPEVLVDDRLKVARRFARHCAAQVQKETGCSMVAVVAQIEDRDRACTSMALDPTLDQEPGLEVTLMKCALARVLSLLVLHLGYEDALTAALAAVEQGAELARLAGLHGDASAG